MEKTSDIPQSVQNLLKPRYKVIADYPASEFFVASIRNEEVFDLGENEYKYSDFPHLFKKLEWWEDRAAEDMPLYVKVNTDKSSLFFGNIHKVSEWFKDEADQYVCRLIDKPSPLYKFHATKFLPATESEYQEYLNSKK